ncbi:MAG: FAD-dependent oxidoreductase [Candidatus Omnitrophica bacterium]|nr:FAD-dependent oxidoreductase [Candidatus Omnitrophota bacterium]
MKYIIIGAGIAGLTAGYRLIDKGHDVIILEKEPDIGGLSRSFRYGSFIFDIGPHRFFTAKEGVDKFIRFMLKRDYIVIGRRNSIHLLNRYFSWPPGPDAFIKLPPNLLLKLFFDMFLKPGPERQDFKNSAIRRYGKTLFGLVFKDYTEKFCCAPCEELHSDWIKVSLEKAIIDKNIKMDSLFDFSRLAYKTMGSKMRFLYPKGGCGRFTQNLGEMISEKGGKIIKGVNNISFGLGDNRVTSLKYTGADKATVEFDRLIYTAPITELARQLNLGAPDLEYLNSVICNIEINKPLRRKEQWIYFGDSDLSFVRVSFPRNFDKDNVPSGRDSLCVEFTCRHNNLLWSDPGFIRGRLIADLARIGLCHKQDIDNIHIEKIANTYPIYKLNYLKELETVKNKLSRFRNLTCLGRTGEFWHNNMDESIEAALKITEDTY